jgi:NAD(P)-dependent dehydrogenase (short-subunit alcohol dehydrogenase family)
MKDNTPDEDGERGSIVNVSSINGDQAMTTMLAYGASKGAVNGLTLPLARDLSRFGIRVNTIAPGAF